MEKEKNKGGRPRIELDEDKITALAKIGCTVAEVAAVMGCSKDTLERRFAAPIEKGREEMKASLKRMQYTAAANGNVTMQIWLGKQYLGQKDRRHEEVTGKDGAELRPVLNVKLT